MELLTTDTGSVGTWYTHCVKCGVQAIMHGCRPSDHICWDCTWTVGEYYMSDGKMKKITHGIHNRIVHKNIREVKISEISMLDLKPGLNLQELHGSISEERLVSDPIKFDLRTHERNGYLYENNIPVLFLF